MLARTRTAEVDHAGHSALREIAASPCCYRRYGARKVFFRVSLPAWPDKPLAPRACSAEVVSRVLYPLQEFDASAYLSKRYGAHTACRFPESDCRHTFGVVAEAMMKQ